MKVVVEDLKNDSLNKVLEEAREHNATEKHWVEFSVFDFSVPQIKYFEFKLMTDLGMTWFGVYETGDQDNYNNYVDIYQHPVTKELVVVSWGVVVGFEAMVTANSALLKGIEAVYEECKDWERNNVK